MLIKTKYFCKKRKNTKFWQKHGKNKAFWQNHWIHGI